MLLSLHVKNFAIIDEIEVNFQDHLNIVTGETGAGKSIILGSINVALGAKVSKEIIRKNADYALVEMVFQMEPMILEKLKEEDLPWEEGELFISRKILSSGRSISKINGETVTTAALKAISSILLDIHGQNEHQSLLDTKKHLEIIDRFSKEDTVLVKERVREHYKEYMKLKYDLDSLETDGDKRTRELEFMRFELNEIQEAKLVPGEDQVLQQQHKRLLNAKEIEEGLGIIHRLCAGDVESAADNIGRAVRQISKISGLDEKLLQFLQQLEDIESCMNDFNRDLSEYMEDLDDGAELFSQVELRLDLIYRLKTKYGKEIPDILAYADRNAEKIKQYENYEENLNEIKDKLARAEHQLLEASNQLSLIRKEKAAVLSERIREALHDLNFNQVCFEIVFSKIGRYSLDGYDEAEFILSLNPGQDMQPLAKVASGGELSRIMLAIKSVLAERDEIHTLIFDEIDAGISGRTAQMVSEKLVMIAASHQVLCITHLPQIAAMADTHFVIEKKSDEASTSTYIRPLEADEVVDELARLIGGAKITDTVLTSAKEMKQLADEQKAKMI